jgi:hypothetical protein
VGRWKNNFFHTAGDPMSVKNCNIDSQLWCLQETVMFTGTLRYLQGNRDAYRSTGNCDVCRD